MEKKNKPSVSDIFYNNKILFVFSLLISIGLWMAVKVNFSGNVTRTVSDVKINLDMALAQETEYQAYISPEDSLVDVEISGKSYDISSKNFSKESIIVEASSGYIDSAGYKVINLSARSNNPDVQITGVYPSSINVFFDRSSKGTFNVNVNLNNDLDTLAEESSYLVGEPVASVNTVEISGPATVLSNINKVFFEAEIPESSLPLTQTTELPATVSYDLKSNRGSQFLVCESVNEETNPATITIPVTKFNTITPTVNFVNEPKSFENNPPKISINPSGVRITSSTNEEALETLTVGTIDFRKLRNEKNTFKFKTSDIAGATIVDKIDSFDVVVDLSEYSSKTVNSVPKNIVLTNQKKGFSYTVDESLGSINEITLIGPQGKLENIKSDDLQFEINVSSLDTNKTGRQRVDVSNISILGAAGKDCWIYGSYYAYVTVID